MKNIVYAYLCMLENVIKISSLFFTPKIPRVQKLTKLCNRKHTEYNHNAIMLMNEYVTDFPIKKRFIQYLPGSKL